MKEGYKRGVRPAVEMPSFENVAQVGKIVVRRFNLAEQGMDVDAVSLLVDPSNNEWQETEAGLLRVDPLFVRETRDGDVLALRLHFERGSELRQHGSNRENGHQFREVSLDNSGQGWQELRRKLVESGRNKKSMKGAKPKWLHVSIVGFEQSA